MHVFCIIVSHKCAHNRHMHKYVHLRMISQTYVTYTLFHAVFRYCLDTAFWNDFVKNVFRQIMCLYNPHLWLLVLHQHQDPAVRVLSLPHQLLQLVVSWWRLPAAWQLLLEAAPIYLLGIISNTQIPYIIKHHLTRAFGLDVLCLFPLIKISTTYRINIKKQLQ